jgi:phosphate-selective porin OprO/OprP
MSQAYLEYAGWKPWENAAPLRFRIGAWATPTGLEDATSNTEHVFLEWAAPADLARAIAGGDGRTGAGVFANGDRWYASGVLTGALMANAGEFDEQTGYLARAAFLPLRGENHAVHIGANVAGVIDPADTNPGPDETLQLRLRGRPELRVDGARFVDTGNIPSDGVVAYGLELGGFYKNFYLTAEGFLFELSRTDGLPDPSFEGWYVQGAWTLTGERRRWNAANGGFTGVRPEKPFNLETGDWGAWEIAARYSFLDLNENEGALGTASLLGAVRGGTQEVVSLGLSWTPNAVIRFILQGQHIRIDRLDPENSSIVTAVPGVGAQVGQEFQTIALRSQVAF